MNYNDFVSMPGRAPALPAYQNNNPYLDAFSTYGGQRNGYNTQVSEGLGTASPISEWTRLTSAYGYGGNDRRGQFAQQQFSKFNNAYQAAQLSNPLLKLRDFISQTNVPGALDEQWRGLSAAQRGLNNASRVNEVRWG